MNKHGNGSIFILFCIRRWRKYKHLHVTSSDKVWHMLISWIHLVSMVRNLLWRLNIFIFAIVFRVLAVIQILDIVAKYLDATLIQCILQVQVILHHHRSVQNLLIITWLYPAMIHHIHKTIIINQSYRCLISCFIRLISQVLNGSIWIVSISTITGPVGPVSIIINMSSIVSISRPKL
jgi:hypothetical protein